MNGSVSVVVVAYGDSPWLPDCVDSILSSRGVDADVVLVDNGGTDGRVEQLSRRVGVTVLRPSTNVGFADGCNRGAVAAKGETLALVNPDVVLEPDCLAELAAVAREPGVGLATASLRLADEPDLINSVGNPVHYVGLAWAGSHGEHAERHSRRAAVASASGACLALRRSLWRELGGFEPAYFAYHEDVELSLRCWQQGLSIEYVPEAVARHFYEFSRNDLKQYLLERNRWLTLLTVYSTRTLVLLAPALVLVELLMLALAARQRWLRAKLRGYSWLVRNWSLVRRRRAHVQAARRRPDREFIDQLSARLAPTNIAAVPGLPAVNAVLAGYWAVVRRAL